MTTPFRTDAGLLTDAEGRVPDMLADLGRLIERETPTADRVAVAAAAADAAALVAERTGLAAESLVVDGCTHLRVRGDDAAPNRVLLLAHLDTVWPIGTLARLPFAVTDGVIRGPGSFDMKTGLVMAIHALALLRDAGRPPRGVCLLVTGDEEIGSPTSRELILTEAAGARAALVLEAAGPGGAWKVGRKGVARYLVEIAGRAAHAGLDPEKGVNAGLELAHQIAAIAGLGDAALGTTVTPTTLGGGTAINTVPATAWVEVDSRARTAQEQQRVDTAMHALTPVLPDASIRVDGGINRPPMEPASGAGLVDLGTEVAAELGIVAPGTMEVGGGSDGNFTAAAGVPTLDGMGAVGDGAHADHEHALVDQLGPRTALLAALVARLLD
ncbi:glutamate carboxypeptidase [Naumannella cuiyingiana]|uniref:Glutamate carboxypeptidase n=1 Tax=Naumannella cuiyingiana TaxID=1347891 RepID=A0A7Z0IJT8_9ACTN|nr:glutamate carboxypeptidase [Naumannella cuiyingiana]